MVIVTIGLFHSVHRTVEIQHQMTAIEHQRELARQGNSLSDTAHFIPTGNMVWNDAFDRAKTSLLATVNQSMAAAETRTANDFALLEHQLEQQIHLQYILMALLLAGICAIVYAIRQHISRPDTAYAIETPPVPAGHNNNSPSPATGDNGTQRQPTSHLADRVTQQRGDSLECSNASHLQEMQSPRQIGNWEIDLINGTLTCSNAFYQLLEVGPARHSFTYASFLNSIHPDDRNQVNQAHTCPSATYVPTNLTYRIQLSGDRIKWINEHCQIDYDAHNKPVRMRCTLEDISARKQLEMTLKQRIEELNERLKELNCLNRIADLLQDNTLTLEQFLEQVVGYLPPAWRQPDYVSARIRYRDKIYQSGACPDKAHSMRAPIVLHGRQHGEIEIFHQISSSEHPQAGDNPFLPEEYRLLETVAHQITQLIAQKQAEEKINLYASVFEHSGESILIMDDKNSIIAANAAFYKLTGYCQQDVLLRSAKSLLLDKVTSEQYQDLLQALYTENFWQGEISLRHKNGLIHVVWLTVSGIRDQQNKLIYYIASFTDITNYRAAIDKIDHLAHYDALTDLPNRFALIERLDQSLKSAERNNEKIAIMFIDLDRFKTVNDTLGHHVGDQLLIQVAKRLKFSVRNSDIVSRLGGDEFVVVLLGLENTSRVFNVADKILLNLGQAYDLEEQQLHTTPSIGIAFFPDNGGNVKEIMKNADTAMYHAKSSGRNNYKFFEASMNAENEERLLLEHDMRNALKRGEFALFYQPKIDTETARVYGVEALLRWQHPEKGLISPSVFVPLAEESGIILPLGEWVIRTACKQLVQWQLRGIKDIQFSINLSQRQLREQNLLSVVTAIIDEEKIDPAFLEFEITESMVMSDPQNTLRSLNLLHGIGIKLSLDDFGTGYSSLSYLKQFPINGIKLDRSYVKDIETDPSDAAICAGTISLAANLGLEVVAEGVETETQRNYLKRLNCHKIQGYYYSKPLPADEAERFVKDRNLSYIAKDKPPHCANILIIDDEQFICDFHAEILENLGHHPTKMINPLAGLELLRQKPDFFELIMLDMLMPKMSGLDLINEIRAINATVPCVVISGHNADAVRKTLKPMEKQHNLLYGINYFILEKPVKANDLKKLLDKILQ